MVNRAPVEKICQLLASNSFSADELHRIREAFRARCEQDGQALVLSMDDYLLTEEVAEKLDMHSSRVRRICKDHDIGVIRGHDRFLTLADVEAVGRLRGVVGRPPKSTQDE